jgi:tricorn protease
MKKALSVLSIFLFACFLVFAESSNEYQLLRSPALNKTQIAFTYAGDLWIVPRGGGLARRLTAGVGTVTHPAFSPDGSMIAYTAKVEGNRDVYVIPANGGVSRRITFHPGDDIVTGWTPDGKILFQSGRNSYGPFDRLYTVTLASGGFPYELPLPIAAEGSYSPDGSRLAYVPLQQWQRAWKRYRGGQTRHIWLANLSTLDIEAIPRDNSNDFNPMWIGGTVYFLSDRNGPVSLFAYDTRSKAVKQVVENTGLDFKTASAGPDGIVYEQFGRICLYDIAADQARPINIEVSGDVPALRPRYIKIDPKKMTNYDISPSGARAVFEAHGEIFTVPAEKGDIRNLTNTANAAEREPSWSPDGKWIAYFSDVSGEYGLELRYQDGIKDVKKFPLGPSSSYYYAPQWSPDSKRIAYTDKHGNLWFLSIDDGKPKLVDTDQFADSGLQPVWSPDGKWIAYAKNQRNMRKSLYFYSVDQAKSHEITDTMSDSRDPLFDPNGKYLYFTASTDEGLSQSWLDMSSANHPVTRAVYVLVLDKTLPSPLPPESDDEKIEDASKPSDNSKTSDSAKDKKLDAGNAGKKESADKDADGEKDKDKDKKKPVVVKVDLDGIDQRVLALPIPARNYEGLWMGKEGVLYLAEGPAVNLITSEGPDPLTIQKFDLSKRKVEKVVDGVTKFTVSANGEKMLMQLAGDKWLIAATDKDVKPDEGVLKMSDMRLYVDPQAEWKQIYRETWRIQREFFYDPHFHGLDIAATEKKYAPYVDKLSTRSDLTYLMEEMLGEMSVGHMFVADPGESDDNAKGGLLGADYQVENDRYRFFRVYNGENWNPDLRAPLTQPGVNVKPGEYLLAVNGRELHSTDNLYSFFQATANKAVTIKVGPNADGKGAREVVVVPLDDESALRNLAWIESNRRKVYELSGGKVAYVWLPDTGPGGYTNFNRYFFAQTDKQGAVIDERFNGGGLLADYIVDYLSRKQQSCLTGREGDLPCSPAMGIFGPKAMIVNEFAGSGGDALPWYFRKMSIGPIVGKRTWGGLVGIGGYPELMDGGRVTSPRWALYGLKGEWEVENHGIQPDYEVELDPKTMASGHDPQLERAVQLVMDQLEKNPPAKYAKPQYPNYHQPTTGAGK